MRLLQSFDFRASPYERPNQKWVCGHRSEGEGCRLGPDKRGRCRTTAECTPRRDGARWVCTRPKRAGGTCAEGPGPHGECGRPVVPCQPVRSVRARRGLAVRWATAVTIGVLMIALFGDDAATWVSPGPLTGHHAEIESCATCHEDFGGGPQGWLHAALSGVEGAKAGDSQQCLACHETGQKPFNPHNLPDARLAELAPENGAAAGTNKVPATLSVARESFTRPHKAGTGPLACADCHSEHQGPGFEITAMSDQQCQVCHATAFQSFDHGHPEIAGFAYGRRTRINFDHVRHMKRHFADAENPPKQCTACHVPAAGGDAMQTRGFQETCAACHSGDVRGTKAAGSPGIPVITVPGLDMLTLREKDVAIGAWPETADRELSPFMRAMLADDAETRRALARFRNLDLLDLRKASEKDIEAVKTVAWAVKGLIYDLIADGPMSLKPALNRAFGREISTETATRLVAGMPLDTLRAAQKEWFPDLAGEIKAHRKGRRVPIPESELATSSAGSGSNSDAPASDGESDNILGGDDGGSDSGSGDSILGDDSGASDGGGGEAILGSESESDADSGGDSILGGDSGSGAESDDSGGESILGGDSSSQSSASSDGESGGESILGGDSGNDESGDGGDDSILGSDSSSDSSESDDSGGESILGGDSSSESSGSTDGGGILSGSQSGGSDDGGGESILGGDDTGDEGGDLLGGGSDNAGENGESETEAGGAIETASMPDPRPGAWTELGGWYRDYFAMLYRPRGHADPFVRTWLDLAGDGYGGSAGKVATAVMDRLGTDKGPGRCIKCHSIDSTSSGLRVNWGEKDPVRVSQFTEFTHDPHLTQVRADAGCATCHRFAPGNAYLASFDDRNPASFASNFQAITTDDCATCHVDGKAGNSCTQCHSYHVGKTPMSDVPTRMDEMSMSDASK